jgi:hypothetical protein
VSGRDRLEAEGSAAPPLPGGAVMNRGGGVAHGACAAGVAGSRSRYPLAPAPALSIITRTSTVETLLTKMWLARARQIQSRAC